MAHELTFRDGVAEMFSVRETPWHREGKVLVEAPTLDDAMVLAGLNFKVLKRPVDIELPNGTTIRSTTAFTTVAEYYDGSGRYVELGAVGPDYQPLQNADAFRALEPLLDAGVASLETGGSIRNGADIWLMAKFNIDRFKAVAREVFAEEIIPFALFTNNHVGRRAPSIMLTPVRTVCANTLTASEELADGGSIKAISVRHTGDVAVRYHEAAEQLLGGLIERYERLAIAFRTLKSTFLSAEQFERLVVWPIAPDPRKDRRWNPEARMAEVVVQRYVDKSNALNQAWFHGAGHTGDGSAWEAYNGAVEVLDHNTELFPNRSGVYRTASMLYGAIRQAKEEVFGNLMAVAS